MIVAPAVTAKRLSAAAWRELSPAAPEPSMIVTLKDVGFPHKGCVHRLCGVGPGGADIVAKRTDLKRAGIEQVVYEQVLAVAPVRSAAFYGSVPEPDSEFAWLFLEDVRGTRVSESHRPLIAEWLGGLHTAAASLPRPAGIPSKGLEYYRGIVQSTLAHIAEALEGDGLDTAQRDLLMTGVDDLDTIDFFWTDLADLCDLPETLMHGDFADKNLIVDDAGGIVAIDWGTAGWGMPATDLRTVDAGRYQAEVSVSWPGVSVEVVERAAKVGRVFERIARMRGVTSGLPAPRSVRSFKNRLRLLREALDAAGWS